MRILVAMAALCCAMAGCAATVTSVPHMRFTHGGQSRCALYLVAAQTSSEPTITVVQGTCPGITEQ